MIIFITSDKISKKNKVKEISTLVDTSTDNMINEPEVHIENNDLKEKKTTKKNKNKKKKNNENVIVDDLKEKKTTKKNKNKKKKNIDNVIVANKVIPVVWLRQMYSIKNTTKAI